MKEYMKKILLDFKALQDAGIPTPCPRCGRENLKTPVSTNAMSRQVSLYVCDDCGTQEAIFEFMHTKKPLEAWACFHRDRPAGDFKAKTHEAAWKEIKKEQLPYLIRLFEKWQSENGLGDFDEYRWEAEKKCKGLHELWNNPFRVSYQTMEGFLIIRFRKGEKGTETSVDTLPRFGMKGLGR